MMVAELVAPERRTAISEGGPDRRGQPVVPRGARRRRSTPNPTCSRRRSARRPSPGSMRCRRAPAQRCCMPRSWARRSGAGWSPPRPSSTTSTSRSKPSTATGLVRREAAEQGCRRRRIRLQARARARRRLRDAPAGHASRVARRRRAPRSNGAPPTRTRSHGSSRTTAVRRASPTRRCGTTCSRPSGLATRWRATRRGTSTRRRSNSRAPTSSGARSVSSAASHSRICGRSIGQWQELTALLPELHGAQEVEALIAGARAMSHSGGHGGDVRVGEASRRAGVGRGT